MAGEDDGFVPAGEEMDEVIYWLAVIHNELALLNRDLREANEKMMAPSEKSIRERAGREIIFPIRPEEIL